MPRKATGSILETPTANGAHITYSARFRAGGRKRCERLGSTADGFTREDAERKLAYLLQKVENGDWTPPAPPPPVVENYVPTFHEFASEWYAARCPGWDDDTQRAYIFQLKMHLLPHFGRMRLDEITVEAIDRYRDKKVAEAEISKTYINATLTRLGQILDVADERDLIVRNPYRINTRNRRAKVDKPARHYLDSPEQIEALLGAAGGMDRAAETDLRTARSGYRRALIAVLVFGGLRIGEALSLRWEHVETAKGRLHVPGTKTDAADRTFVMLPALASELRGLKARTRDTAPDRLVFATATGKPHSRSNTRSRVLAPAIDAANETLLAAGHVPIPKGRGRGASLTQHGLRHTYASVRFALGHDIATVARDGGWGDVTTLLRIYTHAMALDDGSRDRLRALVEGRPLPALNGQIRTGAGETAVEDELADAA